MKMLVSYKCWRKIFSFSAFSGKPGAWSIWTLHQCIRQRIWSWGRLFPHKLLLPPSQIERHYLPFLHFETINTHMCSHICVCVSWCVCWCKFASFFFLAFGVVVGGGGVDLWGQCLEEDKGRGTCALVFFFLFLIFF